VKVLHLANGNLYGGIETFLVTLAGFEHRGYRMLQHHFLLSHHGRLEDELRALGRAVEVLPGARLRHPWAISRVRRGARRLVQQISPDVVLAHGSWAYFVLGHGLPRRGTPVGLFQHGLSNGTLLERLAAFRRPAFVVANSDITAQIAKALIRGTRVVVCRHPVVLPPPSANRAVLRERFDAGENVVIVHTGRFEPWKGHLLLLEALTRIAHLRWELWYVAGQTRPLERGLRADLERLANTRGVSQRVRFFGERRDVADILEAADIYCQPNTGREPFGIALVEAMSSGLPIVTTDLGATADPVDPDIGRRVRVDPTELAAALGELIQDQSKRERLGSAARARYFERHSPEAAIEAFGAVLRSCLQVESAREGV
jgi:glycosyltransferase involved in cell wall biosynthesis